MEECGNEGGSYYPFGLTVSLDANQNVTKNPYKLTTKELESKFDLNLYDFGARMQDMQLGRWLSPDPLAEKYYSLNPYSFCAGNPIKYYDPNGKEIWINSGNTRVRYDGGKLYNQDGSNYTGNVRGFLKKSVNALDKINTSKTGAAMVSALSASKNVFDIKHVSSNPNKQDEFVESSNRKAFAEQLKAENPTAIAGYATKGIDISGGSGGTVYWDPAGVDLNTTNGVQSSSETDLAHEMAHGYDADRGLLNDTRTDGLRASEYNAAYRENLIRGELQLPLRTSYGVHVNDANGNPVPVEIPLLDSKSYPILPAGYKP